MNTQGKRTMKKSLEETKKDDEETRMNCTKTFAMQRKKSVTLVSLQNHICLTQQPTKCRARYEARYQGSVGTDTWAWNKGGMTIRWGYWINWKWKLLLCYAIHLESRLNRQGGCAIAQAVSRRLPTAAARAQNRIWSCGILWWTKVALGQVFFENFGFPCQSTFHLLHLHHHPRLAQ
jgi:hypothetical protein